MTEERTRIDGALRIALDYGGIDGAHHKTWVIDQMVRALTGCPVVVQNGLVQVQSESEEYREWVAAACDGEDGPDTYFWEEGVAP